MVRLTSRASVTVLGAVLFGSAAAAPAQAGSGRDYADHVRSCQADMGFTGVHTRA